jgi:hypothetical protein
MILTSESTKEINTALANAQKDIGFALKDTNNPFFKSKYADLASVWRAVQEPLASNGLSVTQSPGVEVLDGKLFVAVTTRLQHISGEWICGTCYLPSTKHDPQAYGAAITYARRYSLAAFLGVIQEDDDAEGAITRTQAPAKQETPAKKPKATAQEKPGSKDSPKSGEAPDLKTRIQSLNKLMKELGAKTADDCELILTNCQGSVDANPTWAEIKENPAVDVVDVERSIRSWLKVNAPHLKGDEVINDFKMQVRA